MLVLTDIINQMDLIFTEHFPQTQKNICDFYNFIKFYTKFTTYSDFRSLDRYKKIEITP